MYAILHQSAKSFNPEYPHSAPTVPTRDRVSTERVSTYPPFHFWSANYLAIILLNMSTTSCNAYSTVPGIPSIHIVAPPLQYPRCPLPSRVSTPTFNNQSRLGRRGAKNSSRPARVSFWLSFVFKQMLMCSRWGKTWHSGHRVKNMEWFCQEWAGISEVEKKGKILLTIMYITIFWGLLTSWPRCTSQTSARRTSRLPSRYLHREYSWWSTLWWLGPKACRLTSQQHVEFIIKSHLERMVAES